MATWQCVRQCGACCYLEPSDRPDLDLYLSATELDQYLGMVGSDGWCVNYDPIDRACRIYADRPRFCRVETQIFCEMYDLEPEEVNDFAIECCHEQIEAMYGLHSLEMMRFDRAIELPAIELP